MPAREPPAPTRRDPAGAVPDLAGAAFAHQGWEPPAPTRRDPSGAFPTRTAPALSACPWLCLMRPWTGRSARVCPPFPGVAAPGARSPFRGPAVTSSTRSTCSCPHLCGSLGRTESQHCGLIDTLRSPIAVDVSRSCPQTCAQVGEISHPVRGRRPRRHVRRPTSSCGSHDADLQERGVTAVERPDPRKGTECRWARTGDEQGADRGQDVDRRGARCTTVDLSTCRQQEDADRPQPANSPVRPLSCGKGLVPQLPHQ